MNIYLRHIILSITLLFCLPVTAFAQGSISKIVSKLEDNPNCETRAYRETRDPKTHKVVNSQLVVKFRDQSIAKNLIEAFKKERQNAISYTSQNGVNKNKKDCKYLLAFESNSGSISTYTLTYEAKNNIWTLVATVSTDQRPGKYSNQKKGTKRTSRSKDTSYTIFPDDWEIYPDYLDLDYLVVESYISDHL